MQTPTQKDRRKLNADASTIIPLTTGIGRLMAIGKHNGATHERIGSVNNVTIADGRARLEGPAHSAVVDLAQVNSITADFSAAMGEKAMPRLDFLNSSGEPVFSIVALDGRDGFDRAFSAVPAEPLTDGVEPARPERRELAKDDPGFLVLDTIRQSGEPVELRLERPGFTQTWEGIVERVSDGMGFANVMTESFHLHLRGGSVARWNWDNDASRLVALNAEGEPIGLSIRGSASALSALGADGTTL
ncbi:hypothetical protein FPY71_17565 [Aureimonas fodinaquatilis]|uniref:Haemin-degrading HemS/ChuX domain-containing protein n=1 Tax=Aureimonas fodinaquatilis TaxID=2565783 RepID=A0A5B0DNT3_9HYPH|nr:hypothetical protein [Aureimonas fodinaquatilis]KAA0968138.1 hypothetical protein FPY71_17565 [Aureimonas fodinaquatilis]